MEKLGLERMHPWLQSLRLQLLLCTASHRHLGWPALAFSSRPPREQANCTFCPLGGIVSPTARPLEACVPPACSVLRCCNIKAFSSQTWQLAAWERIPFEAWISLLQLFWQTESVVLRERIASQCLCEQTSFSNLRLCVRLDHWNK